MKKMGIVKQSQKSMSLEKFLKVAEEILGAIAHKFKFAYYETDDIVQEGLILAMDAYDSWDGVRDPAPFIYRHLKNRLHNLFRKKCRRSDSPCKKCAAGFSCLGTDGKYCEKYLKWEETQNRRTKVLIFGQFKSTDNFDSSLQDKIESEEVDLVEQVSLGEIKALVDEKIPVELRSDYLRYISGDKMTQSSRNKIKEELGKIIKELGL